MAYTVEGDVVGAIRLALEGAANNEAALRLVQWLVDQAPATPSDDTASTRLLVTAIQSLGFSVSPSAPSGVYAPAEQRAVSRSGSRDDA